MAAHARFRASVLFEREAGSGQREADCRKPGAGSGKRLLEAGSWELEAKARALI
jgi:hypothetical protein